MGLKSLAVTLADGKEMYYSGETIQGFVEFKVDDDSNFEFMELTFYGGAYVHWTESSHSESGSSTAHYKAVETFFNLSQRLTNEVYLLRVECIEFLFRILLHLSKLL